MDAASRPVRVLVVEDDEEIAQVLQRSLRLEGYEVKLAADGVRGLDEAHAFLPDIIVLDLGLPRLDGIDVAKRLRDDGDDTPILMLTARDALESRVRGAGRGRRRLPRQAVRAPGAARPHAGAAAPPSPARHGPAARGRPHAQPRHARGRARGPPIELTQREFELLEYLMRNERLVISRQKLLDEVWGYDPFSITNTIEVFVSNLRESSKPVASLDSSIRSAARATYSAYKRQPIRWRLAGGSAALTLVILCGFAVIVGTLTTRAIYYDFNRQVASAADRLQTSSTTTTRHRPGTATRSTTLRPDLDDYAAANNAAMRVVDRRASARRVGQRAQLGARP